LVLSRGELERIRREAGLASGSVAAQDRKNELKQKSMERVKNWPNTLEAVRKKKESAMKDRAEADELKRQEIDRQEAEIRRNQRLESIRKANDLLYEQTDKMKLLRSQMAYADVIHGRVSQVEEKKKVKDIEKEHAKIFHEQVINSVTRSEEIEKAKIEKQHQLIESVKVSRLEQRDEARKSKEAIAKKNLEDGLKLKEIAKQRAEEELKEYEMKAKHIEEANTKFIAANEELKSQKEKIKEIERIQALEREKEIEKIDYRKNMLKTLEKNTF